MSRFIRTIKGINYVYDQEAYRDENGVSRKKQKLIGKLDATTGDIVPTRGKLKQKLQLGKLYPNVDLLLELKKLQQWVSWRLEVRSESGGIVKPPLNPRTGEYASVSDPSTWATYSDAVKCALENGFAGDAGGIGFMFANGYAGIP